MLWSSRGIGQTNDAAVFVYDYLRRKSLAQVGYISSVDDLKEEDIQIIMLIEQEFSKQEAEKTKRNAGKPRRR